MKRVAIVVSLGLALAAGAAGCGPKNKYCPETGGPCFPPDDTPNDGAVDGDGPEGGDAVSGDAADAGAAH